MVAGVSLRGAVRGKSELLRCRLRHQGKTPANGREGQPYGLVAQKHTAGGRQRWRQLRPDGRFGLKRPLLTWFGAR